MSTSHLRQDCRMALFAVGVMLCVPDAFAVAYTLAANETWNDSEISAKAASYDGVVVPAGSTLTVNNSGAVSFPFTMSGAGVFVKDGTGTLTLSGTSTFTGEIGVSNGVLKTLPAAANAATHLGTPSRVTVADGATLDVSEANSWNTQTTLPESSPLYVSGSGYDGQGAIRRTSGANAGATFGAIHLVGDTTFAGNGRTYGSALHLYGHTFYSLGGGTLNLMFGSGSVDPGTGGSIVLQSGLNLQGDNWSAKDSEMPGNAGNVLRLRDGGSITFTRKKSPVEWTLSVEANGTINGGDWNQGSVYNPDFNTWAGPVAISNQYQLSLNTDAAGKRLTISGPITAEDGGWLWKKGAGSAYITGGMTLGKGTSNQDVSYGRLHMAGSSGVLCVSGGVCSINALYSEGGRLEFIDTVVTGPESGSAGLYQRGTTFADPAYVYGSNTTFGTSSRYWSVSDMENTIGILDLAGSSTFGAYRFTLGSDNGGTATRKAYGSVYHRAGASFSIPSTSGGFRMASGAGSYAYYGMSGGTFYLHQASEANIADAGFAVFRQSGGTFTQDNGTCNVVSNGGEAVIWQTGGAAQARHALGENAADGARFTLAVEGKGTSYTFGSGTWHDRLGFSCTKAVTALLAANDGGIMKTVRFDRTTESMEHARLYLSFNGGGVMPLENSDICNGNTRPPDGVFVHEGGIVWDTSHSKVATSEYGSVISLPLQSPTGRIVSAIALPESAAFAAEKYIGPPKVTISGSGVAAYAVAEFDEDTRTVTGIHIISPGSGYGDDTTATIESADRKSTYACVVTTVDALATGAGLRKIGQGRLRLTGANSWRGPATAEEGSLELESAAALPEGSGLVALANGTVVLGGFARTVPYIGGNGTISGAYALTVTNRLALAAASSPLTVTAPLTLADGVTVDVENFGDVSGGETRRYMLLSAPSGITCAGSVKVPDLGTRWAVHIGNNKITLGRIHGAMLVFR